MKTHDRFQLCWELARRVVERYRAEAPAGCDPQNTWVAIGVGVAGVAVSAGTKMYADNKAKKANAAAMGQAGQAFGRVPDAAQYQPVDFNQEQLNAIVGNYNALPGIDSLAGSTNKFIANDSIRRASKLIPGYTQAMQTYGAAGNDLLNGRLPYSDVLDITSNRNELANSLGTPGAAGPATMKDLGLSQLDAIKAGGGILKDMVGIAETVSPIGRNMTPQSFMFGPQDRINATMQQNQLIQQSDQNAANLEAMGDPAAYAQLQLALAQSGRDQQSTIGMGNQAASLLGTAGSIYTRGQGATGGWGGYTGTSAGATPNYYASRPAYYNGSVVPRGVAA